MKPLNYQERNDYFFKFLVGFSITVGIIVFCLYYTNVTLTEAIDEKKLSYYKGFQIFKRSEDIYIKKMDIINETLNQKLQRMGAISNDIEKDIEDFRKMIRNNKDTSALLNKIVSLYTEVSVAVDERNEKYVKKNGLDLLLKDCEKKSKALDKKQ